MFRTARETLYPELGPSALDSFLCRTRSNTGQAGQRPQSGKTNTRIEMYCMVRAEGLEPSRDLRPNGFFYLLRLSPPCRKARPRDAPVGLWSGLYLHRDRSVFRRSAVGAARLVSTPSPPEFSVGAWLGIAISQGSPNLSSSASPVFRRALKLRLSPMRLPIPPRPRGQLQYKAKSQCEVPSLQPWLPSSCA